MSEAQDDSKSVEEVRAAYTSGTAAIQDFLRVPGSGAKLLACTYAMQVRFRTWYESEAELPSAVQSEDAPSWFMSAFLFERPWYLSAALSALRHAQLDEGFLSELRSRPSVPALVLLSHDDWLDRLRVALDKAREASPDELGDRADRLAAAMRKLHWEDQALSLVATRQFSSAREIARAVGVHRSTLYRSDNFKTAWEALKQLRRGTVPRGRKIDGKVDAWHEGP